MVVNLHHRIKVLTVGIVYQCLSFSISIIFKSIIYFGTEPSVHPLRHRQAPIPNLLPLLKLLLQSSKGRTNQTSHHKLLILFQKRHPTRPVLPPRVIERRESPRVLGQQEFRRRTDEQQHGSVVGEGAGPAQVVHGGAAEIVADSCFHAWNVTGGTCSFGSAGGAGSRRSFRLLRHPLLLLLLLRIARKEESHHARPSSATRHVEQRLAEAIARPHRPSLAVDSSQGVQVVVSDGRDLFGIVGLEVGGRGGDEVGGVLEARVDGGEEGGLSGGRFVEAVVESVGGEVP